MVTGALVGPDVGLDVTGARVVGADVTGAEVTGADVTGAPVTGLAEGINVGSSVATVATGGRLAVGKSVPCEIVGPLVAA